MSTPSATIDIPKNPAQRREWVKYQLALRGMTLAGAARGLGVARQAMSQCFFGPSYRTQSELAKLLGVRHNELFPEYFDGDVYIPRVRIPQRSTRPGRLNVDSAGAR